METKKLDDRQLKLIRDVTEGDQDMHLDPQGPRVVYRRYIFGLLGHVDALEAEHAATMQRVVKDAYTNGAAVGQFIKEQTDRIEALEKTIRKVIYGVRGIDLQCEKWVTAELSRVLPGFDQIGGSDSSDQKANG